MKLFLIFILATTILIGCRVNSNEQSEVKAQTVEDLKKNPPETCKREDAQNQNIKNLIISDLRANHPDRDRALKALGLIDIRLSQDFYERQNSSYFVTFSKMTDKKDGTKVSFSMKIKVNGLKKTEGGYDTTGATIEYGEVDLSMSTPC